MYVYGLPVANADIKVVVSFFFWKGGGGWVSNFESEGIIYFRKNTGHLRVPW